MGNKISGIGMSTTILHKRTKFQALKYLLGQSGWYFISYNIIINLVYKIKVSLSRSSMGNSSLFKYAKEKNIPIYNSNDFNDKEFIFWLKKHKPDLIINRSNHILKDEILNLSRFGCWNIHFSFLPDYRGWAASFWSLFNGEKFVGVTIHEITSKIDCGPIIQQKKIPVLPGVTVFGLQKQCGDEAGILLVNALENIEVLKKKPQKMKGKYYGWPSSCDVRSFLQKGNRLISWSELINI